MFSTIESEWELAAAPWARVPSTAPDRSTKIIATMKQEARVLMEGKLAERISLLNQELAGERTSREVEKRSHVAYLTNSDRRAPKG